jgi:inorganic pyrophosphatase
MTARSIPERLLDRLDPVAEDVVTVVVEIPAGSRNKYETDPRTGHVYLDRTLFTSTRYPADYGYVEGALGSDGDPLDALVFVQEPTFSGCRIWARPVGLFKMWDEKGTDEKILCVPLRDPTWSHVRDLGDIQDPLLAEIEHFFAVYKDLEGKPTGTEGFDDRAAALKVIEAARARAAAAG